MRQSAMVAQVHATIVFVPAPMLVWLPKLRYTTEPAALPFSHAMHTPPSCSSRISVPPLADNSDAMALASGPTGDCVDERQEQLEQ